MAPFLHHAPGHDPFFLASRHPYSSQNPIAQDEIVEQGSARMAKRYEHNSLSSPIVNRLYSMALIGSEGKKRRDAKPAEETQRIAICPTQRPAER